MLNYLKKKLDQKQSVCSLVCVALITKEAHKGDLAQ